ncbi:hypothetical protein LZZ85_03490 [Terrimonas sp. NA20]|uniref:DUF4932 domain-containing protein n=1 Tax=Terrimonas ginsenosidimutans TaxID=2908004 RepID=A0ABS9KLY3_9BACT|nr:hypothetical protein [Terrimonas ginsenosidimutans]MCG2613323.1 hypothetical protein [Terrimonas ginsenosidimutans]
MVQFRRKRFRPLVLFTMMGLIIALTTIRAHHTPAPNPAVQFVHSSLGDYLYLLFNRKTLDHHPDIDSISGIRNLSTLDELIALPEIVTSLQLKYYREIYPLLDRLYKKAGSTTIQKPFQKKLGFGERLPHYDSILALVKAGEAHFSTFDSIWQKQILPEIEAHTAIWKHQLTEMNVLENYQRLTRLYLATDTLQIGALAYHLAGSANYNPTGIYTSLFKTPNLPWVIGHEGTHLLLTGPAGQNWMELPRAKKLAKLAISHKTSLYEMEEAMCHFMQAQLSKTCGTKPADFPIASRYEKGMLRELLAYWEMNWPQYMAGTTTIIDFLIQGGEVVLSL